MVIMNTAGIFLIDSRLLPSSNYLTSINILLQKFIFKFPEAFLTVVIFDDEKEYLYNFEKATSIPRLEIMSSLNKAAIFDTVGSILEKIDILLPIYDIQSVHCTIASLPKDNASRKYNLFQIRQLIQKKKDLGWQFYFPFSTFESLSKDIAF